MGKPLIRFLSETTLTNQIEDNTVVFNQHGFTQLFNGTAVIVQTTPQELLLLDISNRAAVTKTVITLPEDLYLLAYYQMDNNYYYSMFMKDIPSTNYFNVAVSIAPNGLTDPVGANTAALTTPPESETNKYFNADCYLNPPITETPETNFSLSSISSTNSLFTFISFHEDGNAYLNCNCTGYTEFIGVVKKCVSSCSPKFDHVVYNNDVGYTECRSSCRPGQSKMLNQNICYVQNCQDHGLKYYLEENSLDCVASCDQSYSFSYGNTCFEACPSDVPFFDIDTKECLATCFPTYEYVDQDFACRNTCNGLFIDGTSCAASCPEGKGLFRTVGAEHFCLEQCDLNELTKIDFETRPSNSEPLEANSLIGECVTSCSAFTASLTGIQGTFCLSHCPLDKFAEMTENKRCLDTCDPESSLKYSAPTMECVDSCQTAGFTFTTEDLTCLNECSQFKLDGLFCVSECPEHKKYNLNRECVLKCPDEAPFIDGTDCLTECPNKEHAPFCVNSCYTNEVQEMFESNEMTHTPKLFTLPNNKCAESCDITAPFYSADTKTCLSKCPEPNWTPPLLFSHPDGLCASECSTDYRFKDGSNCFALCPSEKPFFVEPEKECLQDCPTSHPLQVKRSICSTDLCDPSCKEKEHECVLQCPPSHPFTLLATGFSECLCSCPEYFEVDPNNICQLICPKETGMVPNSDKTGCDHCQKDRGEFFSEGVCVPTCPPGTAPNGYSVCIPCIDLNLWTNEESRCIPRRECDPLSFFDEAAKICSKCIGEDKLIVRRDNQPYTCEITDCAEGFLEISLHVEICFICSIGTFLEGRECISLCPKNKIHNFIDRKCESWPDKCSEANCINGSCFGDLCDCRDGFTGKACNVSTNQANLKIEEMVEFVWNLLPMQNVPESGLKVFEEIAVVGTQQERLLSASTHKIEDFTDRVIEFVETNYVKHSYQPWLLRILDRLVLMANERANTIKNRGRLEKTISLFDTITDDILTFLSTTSFVPNFEVVSNAKFRGSSLYLSFGSHPRQEPGIELEDCLAKLEEKGITHFPYRYIEFKSIVVKRVFPEALLLKEEPRGELYIYSQKGLVDLNSVCSKRYTSTISDPTLNSSQMQRINQFDSSPYNIFDKTSPFFTNRCVPFSEDSKDITLSERNKDYFVDPKEVCNETREQICEISKEDYKCRCKGIRDRKKSSLEKIADSYPSTNHILFSCFDIYKDAELWSNFGTFMIFYLSLFATLWGIYTVIHTLSLLKKGNRHLFIWSEIKFFDSRRMNRKAFVEEIHRLNTGKTKLKKNTKILLPTKADMAALSAEEQLRLDNRSSFRFFLDSVAIHHNLLRLFFGYTLIKPQIFDCFLYFTKLNVKIMLNAFFIDDSLVEGVNATETHSLLEELPKTIWAILTTQLVLFPLLKMHKWSTTQEEKMKDILVVGNEQHIERYFEYHVGKSFLKKMPFIALGLIMNLFCLYFVVIYIEIYYHSRQIWINGIIMSLVIDVFVLKMLRPIVLTLSRAYAMSKWGDESAFQKGLAIAKILKV